MTPMARTLTRRGFLEAGTLALGGLHLGDLFRLRAEAAASADRPEPDTAVILIWLQGGPSHMETYDLKPSAPVDYRGEMRPIATTAPGMDSCELLPRHGKVADKFTIIRSISHKFANHAGGAGRFLSGRDPLRPLDPVSQFPTIGPIVNRVREARQVVGSTTSKGEYAKDRKLEPNDLLATMYGFLGIDHRAYFHDHSGRPMPILPHGQPIAELL